MNTTTSGWSRWSTKSKAVVAAVTMTAILGAGATGLGIAQGAHPAAGTRADTAARATNAAVPVPDPLADIEAQTEDIFDQVPQNSWDTITTDIAAMRKDWSAYRSTAARDGIPAGVQAGFTRALDTLESSAARRDAAATAQAANDASAAAVEMLGHYDLGHPVEIGRLDVIGRQVILDAQQQELTRAQQQIAAANQELTAARASLNAHGGQQVLTQAQATLTEMTRLAQRHDTTGLTTQAKVLLEVVDGMEQLYG